MLAVVHHHALPERGIDLRREALVTHAEFPDNRRDAWDDGDGELALVRLADPTLRRELLEDAGPLAFRIRSGERGPHVGPEEEQREEQEDTKDRAHPTAHDPCCSTHLPYTSRRVHGYRASWVGHRGDDRWAASAADGHDVYLARVPEEALDGG
jgi:hypothetical protein